MTTYVRTPEAARLLGVSPATLYAYVSRGRIDRRTAADGRTSLFAMDDIETLRTSSRRSDPSPRPTIDVQIASAITRLGDDGVEIRGHPLLDLARHNSFEQVAGLLWTGALPRPGVTWKPATLVDRSALTAALDGAHVDPVGRLAIAATLLGGLHPDDDPAGAARRLIVTAPWVLGSTIATGPIARRLTGAWRSRPPRRMVDAVDTALVLLGDHELATSTLAVRIAASVRTSPYAALTAGLATVEGALHGSAASHVHRFLDRCARTDPVAMVDAARRERSHIPGFGHKIYRTVDPRFEPLLDAVREMAGGDPRVAVVDEVVARVVRTVPTQPNVDLALGALTWLAGFPDDAPIFAVARIAGWAAHYAEEIAESPVRFRGLARTPS